MSSMAQRQVQQPLSPQRKKQTQRVHKSSKSKISKGEKLVYSLFLVVIVFGMYAVISNYASLYVTNHEIQQNEISIQEQIKTNEALALQVRELTDPKRILLEAKGMGMILNEDNVKFTHSN